MPRKLIIAAGIVNLLLAVFHLGFPWLFHWDTALASLSPDNQALVYALSFHCTLVIGAFGLMSVARPSSMLGSPVGRYLAITIAAFYVLRAAEEWMLFRSPWPTAVFFFLLCLALAGMYVGALLATRSVPKQTTSPTY